MNNTTKIVLTGVIGVLIGVSISSLLFRDDFRGKFDEGRCGMKGSALQDQNRPGEGFGMRGEMNGMMMGISGKTGDEFDKAFLMEMIVHHEGAVKMAQQALENAQHQEIKDLATEIILAQNKEITEMKKWASEWYSQ